MERKTHDARAVSQHDATAAGASNSDVVNAHPQWRRWFVDSANFHPARSNFPQPAGRINKKFSRRAANAPKIRQTSSTISSFLSLSFSVVSRRLFRDTLYTVYKVPRNNVPKSENAHANCNKSYNKIYTARRKLTAINFSPFCPAFDSLTSQYSMFCVTV